MQQNNEFSKTLKKEQQVRRESLDINDEQIQLEELNRRLTN